MKDLSEKNRLFESFFAEHHKMGYLYLRKRGLDYDQANDILAKTFELAFVKFDSYVKNNNPYWFYGLLKNQFNDFNRKNNRRQKIEEQLVNDNMDMANSLENKIISQEEITELYAAINKLSGKNYEIVMLKLENYSLQQIAEMLKISYESAKSRLRRALEQLKERL